MFEVVIFDWDGTLADTRHVILFSFKSALSMVHCEVSDEFIERRIGIGSAETFREILSSAKIDFDETSIKNLVAKKIQTEIELSSKVKLFDGLIKPLRIITRQDSNGLGFYEQPRSHRLHAQNHEHPKILRYRPNG